MSVLISFAYNFSHVVVAIRGHPQMPATNGALTEKPNTKAMAVFACCGRMAVW